MGTINKSTRNKIRPDRPAGLALWTFIMIQEERKGKERREGELMSTHAQNHPSPLKRTFKTLPRIGFRIRQGPQVLLINITKIGLLLDASNSVSAASPLW